MLSEQQFLSTYLKIFERLSDFGTQLVPTTSELNLSGSTSYVSAVRMSMRTTPEAQADFEGSIKSYSSNISFSARHASDLCGVMRLAPPCGERRLLLVRFRARRNYNNQYPPYVLKKKKSAFRFKTLVT